jgi:hypothetical protein
MTGDSPGSRIWHVDFQAQYAYFETDEHPDGRLTRRVSRFRIGANWGQLETKYRSANSTIKSIESI